MGTLTFFRVYSGVLKSGDTVYNPVKSKRERIGRILQMHSNNREEIKEVRAGDIAAAVGLKDVTTGDTLCASDSVITLERMEFPEPVISVAVEPKTKSDQEKMGIALSKLAQEDPSFRVRTDEESGQTIISGMGELHLEIIVDRMKREFSVEANVGAPQVSYRETIRKRSSRKASSSARPAAAASTAMSTCASSRRSRAKAYEFVNQIVGGVVPKEYIPAVDKGVQEPWTNGIVAGFPGGGYQGHPVRRLLPRGGLQRDGLQDRRLHVLQRGRGQGKAGLLEPIMKVEVVTPEDYMGDVMGDLNSRRGMVQGMEDAPAGKVIRAEVPLAEMFGYATDLRSATQGRATYSMEFAKYNEVPASIAEAIIQETVISAIGVERDVQREIRTHKAARKRGHDRAR